MYEKYILSKKDNTNIEIKTVITDANLLVTAYFDLMLIKKYITKIAFLESQIMKLRTELEKNKLNYISSTIKLNRALKEHCEVLEKENKQFETEIKHKNQLWKSAFHAYKNLKKQMKKEILELRDAFHTMKVLAVPKAYTDGDYLSTTVLKICNEALKDTEKYVIKEGEK